MEDEETRIQGLEDAYQRQQGQLDALQESFVKRDLLFAEIKARLAALEASIDQHLHQVGAARRERMSTVCVGLHRSDCILPSQTLNVPSSRASAPNLGRLVAAQSSLMLHNGEDLRSQEMHNVAEEPASGSDISAAAIELDIVAEKLHHGEDCFFNISIEEATLAASVSDPADFSISGVALARILQPANVLTFRSVLNANTETNRLISTVHIHDYMIKLQGQSSPNLLLHNVLMSLFCPFGGMGIVWKVFDRMLIRYVIAYPILMMGYTDTGQYEGVQWVLENLVESDGLMGNECVFTCTLGAAASLHFLLDGMQIHACIVTTRVPSDVFVSYVVLGLGNNSIIHPTQCAGNFLERCCFKAIALLVRVLGRLRDTNLQHLPFDMMLAWASLGAASQPVLSVGTERTVESETFSQIALTIPTIADIVTSTDLLDVFTSSYGVFSNVVLSILWPQANVTRLLTFPLMLLVKNAWVQGTVVLEKIYSNDSLQFGYDVTTVQSEDLMVVTFTRLLYFVGLSPNFVHHIDKHSSIADSKIISYSVLRHEWPARSQLFLPALVTTMNSSVLLWRYERPMDIWADWTTNKPQIYTHHVYMRYLVVATDAITCYLHFLLLSDTTQQNSHVSDFSMIGYDPSKGSITNCSWTKIALDFQVLCGWSCRYGCNVVLPCQCKWDMSQSNVVLWPSMVTGCQLNGDAAEAISLFSQMIMVGGNIVPDPVTLVRLISAYAQSKYISCGRCCHSIFVRKCFQFDLSLTIVLLNFYSKVGHLEYARDLCDTMPINDVILWSSMVDCYAQNGNVVEALALCDGMLEDGLVPTYVTVDITLQACIRAHDLEKDREIHDFAVHHGFKLGVMLSITQVAMYMKCSSFEDTVCLFHQMPKTDVVSWAALINGYAHISLIHESLALFRRMLLHGTTPDAVTVVKLLAACSLLGVLQQALCLQGYLVTSSFDSTVFVRAALIDLYSKCGRLDYERSFLSMGPDAASLVEAISAVSFNDELQQARSIVGKVEDNVLSKFTNKLHAHLDENALYGRQPLMQVLTAWLGKVDAIGQSIQELCQSFPNPNLEDKVFQNRGSIVTTRPITLAQRVQDYQTSVVKESKQVVQLKTNDRLPGGNSVWRD